MANIVLKSGHISRIRVFSMAMEADIFDQLSNLPILRNIADLTGRLIGINVVLFSLDGKRTISLTPGTGHPAFCQALQSSPRGLKLCIECDRKHCETALKSHKAISYLCHAGLREFVIPILVEQQVKAFIQCGQVLDAPPAQNAWLATHNKLQFARVSKTSNLETLFMRLSSVAPKAQEDLMALLALLGNYIAESQHLRALFAQKGDSQIIYRAKTFILNHLAQPISLDSIARAAFTSKRNLTRIFRSHENQTVLDYIHDQRIEQACRLLRESNLPCARIAFQSGFGSLQQFNRVFSQTKGQSPLRWRRSISEISYREETLQ